MGQVHFVCDCCRAIIDDDDLHFRLHIDLFAAGDAPKIELPPPGKSVKEEIKAIIEELENADPQEASDEVYCRFEFDLCAKCRNKIYHSFGKGEVFPERANQ